MLYATMHNTYTGFKKMKNEITLVDTILYTKGDEKVEKEIENSAAAVIPSGVAITDIIRRNTISCQPLSYPVE